ncbi:MAG: hypothetical protein VB949_05050 [Pseudomonadales bacterium]
MQVLRSVLGIVFKRQSPERLHYSKQRLISAIIAAIVIATASHIQFFEMSLNAALLKLVFELGVLVVGLRLAWAMSDVDRRRLLKMTLALFLISAFGDGALTTLSAIPLDSRLGPPRQLLAVSIMLAQIIGAVNSVRFGVSVNWRMAGAYVLCYVIVSMLLADLAGVFLQ